MDGSPDRSRHRVSPVYRSRQPGRRWLWPLARLVVLAAAWLLLWGGIGARTGLITWRAPADVGTWWLAGIGWGLWEVYRCFSPGTLDVGPAGIRFRRCGTRRMVRVGWEDIRAARVQRDHGTRLLLHLTAGPTDGRRLTGVRYDPGTRAHPVSTLAGLGADPVALAATLATYVPQRFPDAAGAAEGDAATPRFVWRGRLATPSRILMTVLLGALWGVVDTPGRDRWVPGGFVVFLGILLVGLWQDTVPHLAIDEQGIRYTTEDTPFRHSYPVELLWSQVAEVGVVGSGRRTRLLVRPAGSPREAGALTGAAFGRPLRRYAECPLRGTRADADHVRGALAAHRHRLARTDATG